MSDIVVPSAAPSVDVQPQGQAQPQSRTAPAPKGYQSNNGFEQKGVEQKAEVKAEAPVVPRKIKIKVDGNESEIDESELVARYQK